ncbi:hypothetical protein B0T24DRAFT_534032 [Lasiosphaeria ovina]|uniref:SWIRM domain-containing protein n=1 Tax=Lasiosphaeria ovina TaxID=92902 RepID=A0AAE0N210_9PEZI|nr:hypothetical protein B0T24DRAFT_534032 [Lasiosphaeria ovina]
MQDARPIPTTSSMAADSKKACDISNLMSPPEPTPFDNFSPVPMANMEVPSVVEKRQVPNPPLSPPISPFAKPTSTISPVPHNIAVTDPILYPVSEAATSPSTRPLFNPAPESLETIRAAKLVDEHIAWRPVELFRESSPPKREDYELALYFKSNCLKMFKENPQGWLRKERELLRADRKSAAASRPLVKLHTILPASKPAIQRPQVTKPTANRVQKPKTPKAKTQTPRPIRATPAPARQTIRVSSTPEPRVRTVAPNREDKDFNSLPDICPPLHTLPNKANSLKVDWKGNALDLKHDPHAHLLHPDELLLAAGLRLDCATYLTSKRRIFLRRRDCAKINKEFRKTDAQQACKIDVNKASKLWSAYERVGWLKLEYVQPYLHE